MDEIKYIVERDIHAIDKSGNTLELTTGIGVPYLRSDMEAWDCPVKIDGLYKNLANSTGVDSWQSLQLARNLVVQLLSSFIEDGGKIFLFGDDEEIKLNELQEYF